MRGTSPPAYDFSRIIQTSKQMVAVKIKNLGFAMSRQIRRKNHLQPRRIFLVSRVGCKIFNQKDITQEYKGRHQIIPGGVPPEISKVQSIPVQVPPDSIKGIPGLKAADETMTAFSGR